MFRIIHDVISGSELADIQGELKQAEFYDGAGSASGAARRVKNNQQLDLHQYETLIGRISDRVRAHDHVQGFAVPLEMMPVLINRFGEGMSYGNHVDISIQAGMRVDLSFTLFLSDPASYEGGELVVETELGEQSFKLPAGSLLLYPANRLHRVNEVTSGERFAAVSWIKSAIADTERRDIYIDLHIAMNQLVREHGYSPQTDQISKVMNKLRHFWGRESS
ncbi:MAG: Fe2+-dependent dioxygenase [Marinobacterium sp.]|nr:Fe2+-dependent dioxygenase [Marinobacterium sp.]